MDNKQIINSEYTALCQERGHLQNNLDKINKKLEAIVARIEVLNEATEVLAKADKIRKETLAKATDVKKRLSEE